MVNVNVVTIESRPNATKVSSSAAALGQRQRPHTGGGRSVSNSKRRRIITREINLNLTASSTEQEVIGNSCSLDLDDVHDDSSSSSASELRKGRGFGFDRPACIRNDNAVTHMKIMQCAHISMSHEHAGKGKIRIRRQRRTFSSIPFIYYILVQMICIFSNAIVPTRANGSAHTNALELEEILTDDVKKNIEMEMNSIASGSSPSGIAIGNNNNVRTATSTATAAAATEGSPSSSGSLQNENSESSSGNNNNLSSIRKVQKISVSSSSTNNSHINTNGSSNTNANTNGSPSNTNGHNVQNQNIKPYPSRNASNQQRPNGSSTSASSTSRISSNVNANTSAGAHSSTNANTRHSNPNPNSNSNRQKNQEFLQWCKSALGIQTLLTLQEFEYMDHFHEWKVRGIQEEEFPHNKNININIHNNSARDREDEEWRKWMEPKSISVRGLAATRNIAIGEVVISVPYHALISLHTTIDHDPVLSRVLGPEGRRRYGWTLHKTTGDTNGGSFSGSHGSSGGSSGGVSSGDPREENSMHTSTSTNTNTSTSTASSLNRVGTTSYYEIVLLIVALLYHASLGKLSPLAIYIDSLLQAPTDSMPYLWSEEEWKAVMGMGMGFSGSGGIHNSNGYGPSNTGIEVMKLVRGIQKDIREMYDDVMLVLIRDYPEIFGKTAGSSSEWAFSYSKFEWAFAMVNSRHWHLPLEDLDEVMVDLKRFKEVPDPAATKAGNNGIYGTGSSSGKEHNLDDTTTASTIDAVNNMPASQPTDQYVSSHDEATRMEHIEEYVNPSASSPAPAYSRSSSQSDSNSNSNIIVTKHSFMAPLADMLNFGPPCTRGQYNPTTQAFEVVATCSFLAGQEVTFWYSDDCDDVILANYGFTHPMVPRCPTIEDWKYRSHMWKEYAESMEKTLSDAYEDLYDLLEELKGCDCTGSTGSGVSGDKRDGNNSNGNFNGGRERYQSHLKGDNRDAHKQGDKTNEKEKGQGQEKNKPVGTDKTGSSSSSKRIRKVKRRNVNAAEERDEIGL